jgi:hypothetical protein
MVSGNHLHAQRYVGVHSVSRLDAAVIADTEVPARNMPVERGDGRRQLARPSTRTPLALT